MNPRLILTVATVLGGLFAASCLFAAEDLSIQPTSEKAYVVDGHVNHTVGNLHNHVTNFGLMGSRPSVPSSFSHAPSARWGGVNYLWSAGVWIGGTMLGVPMVSTGQYQKEFRSTLAAGDTIFATARGALGGTRFPWPGADDDGDGFEDEDPLDGLDNDLDGLIDEDFAAIGDQHFRCTMADDLPEIIQDYPDHAPLNLKIVQESFQWAEPLAADFIGYEYRITNNGATDIDGLHCGIFADFDIGAQANDELAGSWVGMIQAPDGSFRPVSVGWMRDVASLNPAPGWVGFVMCGVETDAAAGPPADPMAMPSFQRFSGMETFENGGDPTNDAERYELLHLVGRDPDVLPGMENDYRLLMSTPEITTLAPGETVTFRFALVIGSSKTAMLDSALEAVVTAGGMSFDRDGDPANGEEFHVPWIRPDDVPVPAVTGHLQASLGPETVSLVFDVQHAEFGGAAVDRRQSQGVPPRTWRADRFNGSIIDDDKVGWPRIYDLKLKSDDGPDLVLDTVEVKRPPKARLLLDPFPNPFNPRLTVKYSLPSAGSARLEILDLKGQVVKVLFDGHRPAGADRIDWNGLDGRGRAAASGVYLVRLVSDLKTTQQQVTLLR
ncbi:MAG: FlgD immunoglobulin-like domain containing protein [Candidatus Krumholzibacteriota bacterium]